MKRIFKRFAALLLALACIAAYCGFTNNFVSFVFSAVAVSDSSFCHADGDRGDTNSELPPDFFDDCDGGETCPSRAFTDVPSPGNWAHKPIDWALNRHISTGIGEGRFGPNESCTRSQAMTFLWRASGSPEPEETDCPFADVPANAYYYKPVMWAVQKGITSGTGDTTFGPNDVCSRAQIMTFVWRMKGSPEPAQITEKFSDVGVDKYYLKPVSWAIENGVTAGTSATTFGPNDPCSRAQILAFLYKATH